MKPSNMHKYFLMFCLFIFFPTMTQAQESFSGIYPHLAFFNNENECGTGAVVPWADRLWVVTYAPHSPKGSSDKLYEITQDLKLNIRPESIGGTPANRMIHKESQQLFIGPYAIDKNRNVRVIPYSQMLGRPTANARHLSSPKKKIYYATMEEGLYEVDVKTLHVTEIYADNYSKNGRQSGLPGYHGKGLYSGYNRVIYANNGEKGSEAQRNPFVPSGVLAEWNGMDWNILQRAQFTEVTGPGGIYGNEHPEKDPVWSVGWDSKSLLLMLLDKGKWHRYRLPKASHSYDGAHGWNTEWPRIREIGEKDLLMTMHGMFWKFPKTLSANHSSGIAPRSTYLKVVGDFCRWQNQIVLGCDDTAKNEFLNKRKAKGHIAAPQSQSNLWFLKPELLDQLGPVIGRGAVWLNDNIKPDKPSDAYLFSNFKNRAVHLSSDIKTTMTFEIDIKGNGQWTKLRDIQVHGYLWHQFDESIEATWIRIRSSKPLTKASAWFHYSNNDQQTSTNSTKFRGIGKPGDSSLTGGLIRSRARNHRTLQFAAKNGNGKIGHYILDSNIKLTLDHDNEAWNWLQSNAAIPSRKGVLEVDEASVIYTDYQGKRYRLPKNSKYITAGPLGFGRLCREVATERDLFNCHGTFYELPANNAGGFARIRPISTHNLFINDFCSYRGLLVLSGTNKKTIANNRHIIQSKDGKASLWVGAIDDIWELGKPTGTGGPWLNTNVEPYQYSDPYLMTGYDQKVLVLKSSERSTIQIEVDITGRNDWHLYKTIPVESNKSVRFQFPQGFQAYWIRFKSDVNTKASAQLIYQ